MTLNALDMIFLPLVRGLGIGYLSMAAAWILLKTAARFWHQAVNRKHAAGSEAAMIRPRSLVFRVERTAKHE